MSTESRVIARKIIAKAKAAPFGKREDIMLIEISLALDAVARRFKECTAENIELKAKLKLKELVG